MDKKEKLVNQYTLYVWNDKLQKYSIYCTYSTLERVKQQIELYKQNKDNRRWNVWKGCKPIDIENAQYYVRHKMFKVTEEVIDAKVVLTKGVNPDVCSH